MNRIEGDATVAEIAYDVRAFDLLPIPAPNLEPSPWERAFGDLALFLVRMLSVSVPPIIWQTTFQWIGHVDRDGARVDYRILLPSRIEWANFGAIGRYLVIHEVCRDQGAE